MLITSKEDGRSHGVEKRKLYFAAEGEINGMN
jgi:hypothetical protein